MPDKTNHIKLTKGSAAAIGNFFLEYKHCLLLEENGIVKYATPYISKLMGMKQEDMLNKPLLNFIHPNHQNEIKKTYRLLRFMKEVNFKSYQICLLNASHQKVFMETFGSLYADESNKTHGIIFLDHINENKYEQNLLRENERRLRLAEQAANFGIWEWNIKKKNMYISEHVENILHVDKNSFTGSEEQFWKFFDDQTLSSLEHELKRSFNSDKKLNIRLHLKNNPMKSGWIRLVGELKRNSKGLPLKMFGIIENVDEIVKYEDKILNRNKELSEINSEKNRFFSVIAHDIRTPFNAILGFSEVLHDDYYDIDDETRLRYIDTIRRSGIHTYEFIENLLIWTRSQMNKISYNPTRISVCQIFDTLSDIFKPVYNKKQIEFIIRCNEKIEVFADEDMLKTSMRNLISNAIKYTHPGGKVQLSADFNEQKVRIQVKDNGIGMDKEKASSLFNLNTGFSTPGTNNESGTGMGMIICKDFITKNKGTVHVESELGKGSAFTVTLPLAK